MCHMADTLDSFHEVQFGCNDVQDRFAQGYNPGDEGKEASTTMKKTYERPELEVFGTVVELTQNACNFIGDDGKTCRSNNLAFIGRSTPGSDNAGFPKK